MKSNCASKVFLLCAATALAAACGTSAGNSGGKVTGTDAAGDGQLAEDATPVTDAAPDLVGADLPGDDVTATGDAGGDDAATDDADAGAGTDALQPDDAQTDAVEPVDADAAVGTDAVVVDADSAAGTDAQSTDAQTGDADASDGGADVAPTCSAALCDDGNPCTDDGCDAGGKCVHGPKPGCGSTPAPCNKADGCATGVCNLSLHLCVPCQKTSDCGGKGICENEKCVPAVACSSDGQCKATNQVCDKGLGFCVDCVSQGDCKSTETCSGTHCVAAPSKCGSSKDCPGILVCDKNAGICVGCVVNGDCPPEQNCSASTCVAKVCTEPVCVNGSAWGCNSEGSGYSSSPLSCDDGQDCTTDLCAPGLGCQHSFNSAPCVDGNPCTTGDSCAGGKCAAGKPLDCNDNNPCTSDSCSLSAGCVHLQNDVTACDDGSSCTTGDTCKNSVCIGSTTVTCDDGNACTADSCDKTGCVHSASAGVCEDGNPCTLSDSCGGSTCKAGIANSCDDGNECTVDACDPKSGCSHVAKSGCVPVSLPPCATSTDCTGGTICNVSNQTCVECLTYSDCGAGHLCQDHVCKAAPTCGSDVQCKATKQVCNLTAKVCVDCNGPTDCDTGQACKNNLCVAAKPCGSSKDCPKVCDLGVGKCVDCLSNDDCGPTLFCDSDHVCRADVCSGPTCNGGKLWSCLTDGSGYSSATSCDDNVLCTQDSCSAKACVHTNTTIVGAVEFPGNGVDDDCNGKTDDSTACDSNLSSSSDGDYAKALDLCSGISDSPILSSSKARGIRGKFGSVFAPQWGSNMVMLSTGVALASGDAGYVAPQNGTDFSFASASVSVGKCAGAKIKDPAVLRVQVAVPINASGMAFDFAFFSSEYPEWIGGTFSDSFTVVVTGKAWSGDVVGEANGKCFNSNNITFSSCTDCKNGDGGLAGTGYDAGVGGGYGWSTASFPVKGGDSVTVEFSIFDVGDGILDSAVLLDNLRFTGSSSTKPTLVSK